MKRPRLHRKSSRSNARRQRSASDLQPASPLFAYRANRTEQEVNTGRQVQRETAVTDPKHIGRFLLQRFGLIILLLALVVSAVNTLSLSTEVRVMPLTIGND